MTVKAPPTLGEKVCVKRHRRTIPVAVLAVCLVHLAAAAPSAKAAMWSVIPKAGWNCSSPGNGCLTATGFHPNRNFVEDWRQGMNPRGNCTKYAAYRLRRNGASNFLRGGNATTWRAHALAARKRVDGKPAVGAVAWWSGSNRHFGAGGAGHVAYIERVAKGVVFLSDSRWNSGSRRWTVTRASSRWPEAFLHIKDRPKPKPKPKPKPAPPPAAPKPAPMPKPAPSPKPKPKPKSTLRNDERLLASKNQYLRSADGRYRFVMQGDSNLVLYGPSGRALWASNTVGRGAHHVRMQGDGNLVIYTASNRPIWASNTPRHYNARLVVQNDGNVVIYSGSKPIWATGTDGRR